MVADSFMYSLQLQALRELYADIDRRIAALQEQSGVRCVHGCGKCCTSFEPYISLLEALPIVEYLHADPASLQAFYQAPRDKSGILCPFYDPQNPRHCTIYPIRALICRLFAFSAERHGHTVCYAPCKAIQREYPREVALASQLVGAGLLIPVYLDMAQRLRSISFELATDLHPFTDSVEIALRHYDAIGSGTYHPELTGDTNPTIVSGSQANQNGLAVPFSVMVRKHLKHH